MVSVAPAAVLLHVERLPAQARVAPDPRSKVIVVREQLHVDLTRVVQAVEEGDLHVAERQERPEQFAGLIDAMRGPRNGCATMSFSSRTSIHAFSSESGEKPVAPASRWSCSLVNIRPPRPRFGGALARAR